MITAVDTNVVLDILTGNPEFGPASLRVMRRCRQEGLLIACGVVWAEVASGYPTAEAAREAMVALEVSFSATGVDAALAAGEARGEYGRRGGSRARVIPDFLVSAHALFHSDRLLTRDRGFYRSYFPQLTVLDPTSGA